MTPVNLSSQTGTGHHEVSHRSEIKDQPDGAERLLQRSKQDKTTRESRPIYLFTLTKMGGGGGLMLISRKGLSETLQ